MVQIMYNIQRQINEILDDFILKARSNHTSKLDIRTPIHKLIDAYERDCNICVIAGGNSHYNTF